MCIIDRKIYLHSDGRRETVETTTRCKRAVGNSLCKHVVRREPKGAQLVETKPSHGRTPSDGFVVTERRNGRERLYRDVSNRSSTGSSIQQGYAMSDQSSMSTPPSSASSPFHSETKTAGPMPPPLTETTSPSFERSRQPYPPIPPPEPGMIIGPDGTAQYQRPPSLSMERATEIERQSTSSGERSLPKEVSFSSTKAEVDDRDEPRPSRQPRKPSIKIRTDVQSSRSSSTPSVESPGLSNLPRAGHLRKDSAKDVPKRESDKHVRYRSDSDRDKRRKDDIPRRRGTDDDRLRRDAEDRRRRDEDRSSRDESDRRRRDEERRQAQLERDRLAESDRRQSAREELAREATRVRLQETTPEDIPSEASRERHRQATLAALEADEEDEYDYDPVRQYIDAEEEQMARERAAAAQRRESLNAMPNDFPAPYVNDQLRRDAEARARYQARRADRPSTPTTRPADRPSTPATRPSAYRYSTSPVSSRSPVSTRALPSARTQPPVVHQYPSARHSGTIPQRGADVLAREQARGSGGGNLADSFGNLTLGGGPAAGEPGEPSGGEYYYDQEPKDGSRRRRKEFWP